MPFAKSRMRNLETRRTLDNVAKQNQIEIKSSGRARVRTRSSVGLFDSQEMVEDLTCVERRIANRNGIQISRLILQPFPFRIGFDEIRDREIGDEAREAINGKPERGFSVAEV